MARRCGSRRLAPERPAALYVQAALTGAANKEARSYAARPEQALVPEYDDAATGHPGKVRNGDLFSPEMPGYAMPVHAVRMRLVSRPTGPDAEPKRLWRVSCSRRKLAGDGAGLEGVHLTLVISAEIRAVIAAGSLCRTGARVAEGDMFRSPPRAPSWS